MRLKNLSLVLGVSCLLFAASAPAQVITNIDDIQAYTDAGAPASPLSGQVVTVRGVLTVNRGTYNSGTHYVQDPTGGIQVFNSSSPVLAVGDSVEVTGTVGTFSGEIQLSSNPTFTYIDTVGEPAPLELTVSEAVDWDGNGVPSAGDFEILGTFSAVTGNVRLIEGQTPPWDPTADGQGVFGLTDASLDTFQVFVDRTTTIDVTGIAVGEAYRVLGPISIFSARLQIKPRVQTDLVENPGNPFPVIENITPNPWAPDFGEAVNISAQISDNGTLTATTLYYAYDDMGNFTPVALVDDGFGNFSATIPGTNTGNGIQYYLEATDDAAQTTRVPGDAPASSLTLAVGFTPIQVIQSERDPLTGDSNYVGQIVNVEALVTVAPGELQDGGTSNYVIGDEAGGPWSGMFIFEGSGANIFLRGDRVRVAGTVGEFNGITEIIPLRGDAIYLVDFGNPLPPLKALSTETLDTTEKWESVVVGTFSASVVDTAFAGVEWLLQDAVSDSSLYVDPAPGVSITAALGEQMYVTGFLDTRFARNELVPRQDDDIIFANSVDSPMAPTPRQAAIESVTPNPFNPSTKIEFSIPRNGQAELAIFNARGERVRTLLSGELQEGTHFRVWDGRDDRRSSVGSGVYYARLRFGTESLSVSKLTLVK